MFLTNKNGFYSFRKLDNIEMKILHIVEEFSKKNTSVLTVANFYLKFNSKEKKNESIFSLKNLNFINFFKLLKKKEAKVLHIHGMWRLKQILFCLLAKFLKIKIIIQPHGMLLDEAIKSGNYLKYIFKKLIILFYKYLIIEIYFIAVTKEELNSIKYFFKKSIVRLIKNPFKSNYYLSKTIRKNFCYFGRINKHKNLELMILSFIKAQTDKSWKFLIYGISEDKEYYKNLKIIIKKYNYQKKIFFKKPIFKDKLKFKAMSQSSYNIIMSKSEILNLSILESLSLGTKVIVNKMIKYPKELSKLIIFSQPNVINLSKKIHELSKEKNNNFLNKRKLQKKFLKNYNLNNIEVEYLNFLNDISLDN